MTKHLKQVIAVTGEELLNSLRNGDDKALKTIYRQNYHTIINLITSNAGSLQEAKDIYQEALIIFYEKVREESFELNCQIKTFLYSVSRRLWLKQLQRRQRYTTPLTDTDEVIDLNWEEVGNKEDQFEAMHTALESLGEPCKSILKDFYLRNHSMEEISDKFGYTNADNAKNQKYKCLKRLKKVFFEVYKQEEII